MVINQELLRTFVVAARAPTFAEAAARRRVTKSAISQQIKTLETQLGVPLFERVGRNVRLTTQGSALADVVARQLAVIDEALEEVVAAHGQVRGVLRIGAPRPFARVWLRPRVAKLLRAHEGLRLRIVFGGPTELEALLVRGELDLALLVAAPESPQLETKPVHVETFAAYASPRYLKAHGRPRTATELSSHRFVVFDHDLPMHAQWWRASFGARTPLSGIIVCEVASLDEQLAFAEDGVGIAVLPDYFAEASVRANKLVTLAVRRAGGKDQSPPRNTIHLAWRRAAVDTARLRAGRGALLP